MTIEGEVASDSQARDRRGRLRARRAVFRGGPLLVSLLLLAACAGAGPGTSTSTDASSSMPASVPATSPDAPAPTATAIASAQPSAPQGQALVDLLRDGGMVIFFRHAATDMSQTDSDLDNLEDCATQRNLSEDGRAGARAIGQAFRNLGLPIGQVLASPYCRTLETAQLAFERAEPSQDLLPTAAAPDEASRAALVASLQRLLSTVPPKGTNTVLVSHAFSLEDAADVSLAEGEAAVFVAVGPDGFRLVGRVLPDHWAALVESAATASPAALATARP